MLVVLLLFSFLPFVPIFLLPSAFSFAPCIFLFIFVLLRLAVAPSGESRVRDKLQPLQVHAQPDPQRFDVALLQGPEAVKLQLPTAKTE